MTIVVGLCSLWLLCLFVICLYWQVKLMLLWFCSKWSLFPKVSHDISCELWSSKNLVCHHSRFDVWKKRNSLLWGVLSDPDPPNPFTQVRIWKWQLLNKDQYACDGQLIFLNGLKSIISSCCRCLINIPLLLKSQKHVFYMLSYRFKVLWPLSLWHVTEPLFNQLINASLTR